MTDKIIFVAFLYLMTAGSLFGGLLGIYGKYDYAFNYQLGQMTLAQKLPNKFDTFRDDELLMIPVIFETPSGNISVPRKYIQGHEAKQMNAGTKIPLFISTKDPSMTHRAGQEPQGEPLLIIVSILVFFAARYAHKLLREDYDNA